MDPREQLAKLFEQFPGIGRRQARRFVDYLIRVSPQTVDALTRQIKEARSNTRQCKESMCMYTLNTGETDSGLSPIAKNPKRDRATLMITEDDHDVAAIESSKSYNGQYYVVGELLSLVTDHFDEHSRASNLLARIEMGVKKDNLKEIIFALPLTTEGEHTKHTIENMIVPLCTKNGIALSSLARGLSTGSEIEYTDSATLESAIKGRK